MVQSMVSLEYVRRYHTHVSCLIDSFSHRGASSLLIGSLGPFKASGRMMTILLF